MSTQDMKQHVVDMKLLSVRDVLLHCQTYAPWFCSFRLWHFI